MAKWANIPADRLVKLPTYWYEWAQFCKSVEDGVISAKSKDNARRNELAASRNRKRR